MEFYLNIDGDQRGPLDPAEFRELVRNKTVSQEDYVWEAKQSRWIKIKFSAELASVFEEEATLAAAEDEGFFINVEGKTGGPFPRDAILKEIERGRFQENHFVWDAVANRWLKAADHPVFSRFLGEGAKPAAPKYYLSKEGARFGPFEFEDVEEKILNREFAPEHYVWEPQVKQWVPLGEMVDFANLFAEAKTAEPEVPPPVPTAEAARPSIADLMAGPPAPAAPAVPAGPPEPAAPEIPQAAVTAPAPDIPAAPGTTPGPPGQPPGLTPPPAGAPETKVGDLVSISIPPPTTESKPPPPGGAPQVSVDEVEFKKVAAEKEEEPLAEEEGPAVDRSVVLDFSRPSFLRRITAQLIDLFVVSLSYFAVALIFSFLEMNPYLPGPDQYYYQQLFWGTLTGIAVFYLLVRDAGGASLGKRIAGLRVVKYGDFNRRASLVHSIVRNFTLLIPLLNILDGIYAFTDVKGRRLGDRAAGTILTESQEIDYIRQHRTILDEIY
jgi:uncharacterized RDD family membrane protein YckC